MIQTIASGAQRPEIIAMGHGIHKRYEDQVAIANIDLTLYQGEILGLLGPMRSGKTTLLEILSGRITPSGGETRILNRNPRHLAEDQHSSVSYLPENPGLNMHLTIQEHLERAHTDIAPLNAAQQTHDIDRTLDYLRLREIADRPVMTLSPGLRRRLALAIAIVHWPQVLLLDEPFADIEPMLLAPSWSIIEQLRQDGMTIVIASADLTCADRCDRVILLQHGQELASGTPDDIRNQVFGGDLLFAEIIGLNRATTNDILGLPYVRKGIRLSDWTVELAVEDAEFSAIRLASDIQAQGLTVVHINRYRVPFDRVFKSLSQ